MRIFLELPSLIWMLFFGMENCNIGFVINHVDMVVQLGFSVDIEDEDHRMLVGHHSPNYQEWDGGQMGGRPTWLNPKDLPKHFIQCRNCDDKPPMMFICQLYAPCEDVNPNAYHRSLYVFACPSCDENNGPNNITTGSVRVLRAQLPKENPYFPPVPPQDDQQQHLPQCWNIPLCQVCGQRSNGKCPLQQQYFCGPHHQREYKKYIFGNHQIQSRQLQQQSSSLSSFSSLFLPSVLTESELVVEDEPTEMVVQHDDVTTLFKTTKQLKQQHAAELDKGNDDDGDDDDDDEDDDDQKLEQQDLNEMIGAADETISRDSVTMAFYDRMNKFANVRTQCLRYLRWPDQSMCLETGTPLWIRSDYQPDSNNSNNDNNNNTTIPPPCDRCGSERRFEFQLMPQMLHYLFRDLERERSKTQPERIKVNREDIAALKMATSIMEQAPPEQIPPDFAANKEAAIDTLRNKLMGEDLKKGPSWGVVSIYTCTKSCGDGMDVDLDVDAELGAYVEEFAWKQPSLD
jgi:pre-rRNA-processing protein TSR4